MNNYKRNELIDKFIRGRSYLGENNNFNNKTICFGIKEEQMGEMGRCRERNSCD